MPASPRPPAFVTPAPVPARAARARPSACARSCRARAPAAVAASPHAHPDPAHSVSRPPPSAPAAAPASQRAAAPAAPAHPGPAHFLVTIVASQWDQLTPAFASVSALVESAGGRVAEWRALGPSATEALVTLPRDVHLDHLRTQLFHHGRAASVDVVLQEESVARCPKRLAVFDLDSTLIAQETIDELASELHVESHVKAITERAMNGEIGFRDALAERVALLRGLPVHALDGVKQRVVFTPGAPELIRALTALGCKTAVVSGGFHFLADHVRDVLGLDYSFANRLEADHRNVLTGRTVGDIVDAEYKETTLQKLANALHLKPQQVLAVGDGSNDLLMMQRAGLGVAFNAKPIVQDRAKCRVNQASLRNVLYLLRLSDEEIERLIQ